MVIKQLYTGCISEAAYFIEDNGEAAIIDPLRDVDVYLKLAEEHQSTIKYIFETHFHADFVSGHLDLEKATGAPIVYGPNTETRFPIYRAKDNEEFAVGKLTIQVIHTPGHTMESVCYLLKDETGLPHALFTGDTLFIGDVGRPDLSSGFLDKEELAAILYDSIHKRIMQLPDHVLIYPAHGEGSSCGKNLGSDTVSTIGEQKRMNYALQPMSKEDFVKTVTEGLSAPPLYFPVNARINKEGYESLDAILQKGLTPASVERVKQLIREDEAIVLDTRTGADFSDGFVPGSINIGLDGRFAEWAGILLPFDKDIFLVTEKGQEKETIIRLARVGFSRMTGYLEGGFDSWRDAGESFDMIIGVEADELAMDIPHDDNLVVVDVRRETEFGDGHVAGAINIPLDEIKDPGTLANFEDNHNIYIHCASGYRSVIAASLIKREGIHNVRNVLGGYKSIKEQDRIELVKEKSVLN